MATREASILYQVAFKGAIELIANGTIELETDDYGAEVFAVADVLYDGLAVKAGQEDEGKAKRTTRSSSGGSSKRASSPRGNTRSSDNGEVKLKHPDAPATAPQVKKVKALLKENDVEYDRNGFDFDGDEYEFNELTMQEASDIIQALI